MSIAHIGAAFDFKRDLGDPRTSKIFLHADIRVAGECQADCSTRGVLDDEPPLTALGEEPLDDFPDGKKHVLRRLLSDLDVLLALKERAQRDERVVPRHHEG